MDGIHDMGGLQGFGPVPLEKDTVFDHPWQKRAFALADVLAYVVPFSSDQHRYAIERIPPAQYLTLDYFDKWTIANQTLLKEAGLADADELATGRKRFDVTGAQPPVTPAEALSATRQGLDMMHEPGDARPRFAPGDAVRVAAHGKTGHTRMPRYLWGRKGQVLRTLGMVQFADTMAAGEGPCPHFCYTVRFTASELWGDEAEANDAMHADLWEPYLDRA